MGKVDPPLGALPKFFCVLAGTVTFFTVSFFVLLTMDPVRAEWALRQTGALFVVVMVSIPALVVASIVSWRNKRHGPVRLFLTGIILPALVSVIIRAALVPWMGVGHDMQSQSEPSSESE